MTACPCTDPAASDTRSTWFDGQIPEVLSATWRVGAASRVCVTGSMAWKVTSKRAATGTASRRPTLWYTTASARSRH